MARGARSFRRVRRMIVVVIKFNAHCSLAHSKSGKLPYPCLPVGVEDASCCFVREGVRKVP